MRAPYLERLARRSAATGTVLCLGIDPDPAALPSGFSPTVEGIERFARLLIEAGAPFAAAVKANLAFFEAFGSGGVAAFERIRGAVPDDVPFIADAKRADIGSTAERQATALFDALGADAVTLNPYLGADAIEPFLERSDRFAYVLCRTSNRSGGEVQGLTVGDDPRGRPGNERLYARIARDVERWDPGGMLGLVVGATAADELREIRSIVPGLAFLVPGIGAQGGSVEPVLRDGPATVPPAGDRAGGGLLVNVSRAIAGAALGGVGGAGAGPGSRDPGDRIGRAASEWAAKLPVLR